MAMPSRPKTFGLENCQDLLRKLEWEFNGLKEAADRDDPEDLIFRAFNAAVTACHMADWVWEDMTEEQRETLRSDWNERLPNDGREFRGTIRRKNDVLAACWEIATASKHVEVTSRPNDTIRTTVSATSSLVLADGVPVGCGKSPVVTMTGWVLKVNVGGESHKFIDVIDDATQFWTEFVRDRGIAK